VRERERERESDRDIEKRNTQNNLSWFLPQYGSSPVPSSLTRYFHYNHTRLQLPKHKNKKLPMLKHTSKRLLTIKDYKENCLD